MTLKGGTSQACAACKYQRRKCFPECLLAPYFPADQPKMFQNAHKLFGVSNILKILKNVDPSQKNEAMHSIKCQAYFRDKYPVHGCLGVIRQLYYHIQVVEEEFQAVNAQLEMYRQQHHQPPSMASLSLDDVPSQLELGMAPPCNGSQQLPLFNPNNHVMQQQQHSYSYIDSSSKENNVGNSMWLSYNNNNNTTNNNYDNNTNATDQIQSQMVSTAVREEVLHADYDEIHPFFDTIDDDDDPKEAYETSSEESLKETQSQSKSIQNVAENELKSAAACFALTGVN